MATAVTATAFPLDSLIGRALPAVDFADAWTAPLGDPSVTPVEIALAVFARTPGWVDHAMAVRNWVVSWFGLKTPGVLSAVGSKPTAAYRVGDRIGIFEIFAMSDDEVLLGIDDSHLDVRVSVLKSVDGQRYVVATSVKRHNWLGRLYMLPVGIAHPFVVRATMRNGRL